MVCVCRHIWPRHVASCYLVVIFCVLSAGDWSNMYTASGYTAKDSANLAVAIRISSWHVVLLSFALVVLLLWLVVTYLLWEPSLWCLRTLCADSCSCSCVKDTKRKADASLMRTGVVNSPSYYHAVPEEVRLLVVSCVVVEYNLHGVACRWLRKFAPGAG
jgi:hypothetical protein